MTSLLSHYIVWGKFRTSPLRAGTINNECSVNRAEQRTQIQTKIPAERKTASLAMNGASFLMVEMKLYGY